MKKTITLLLALLSAALLLAKPYTQQGIAYLYDYKTKTKKPVGNVRITVVGAQPTISKDDGTFTLVFDSYGLGDKVSFEKQPYYQGMKVFNKKEVDNWFIVKDRLRLIMCRYEEFELAKNNSYQQGLKAATEKYEREIAQIQANQKLKEAERKQQLQEAEEQLQKSMESLSESSEEIARIDESELDVPMQEVLNLYKQGDILAAKEKLDSLDLIGKLCRIDEDIETLAQQKAQKEENRQRTIAAMKAAVPTLKNMCEWKTAGTYLKTIADKLNTYDDIFAYACFCQEQNDFKEAEVYYEKALDICQRLAKDNPKAYETDVALTLNNLANLYSDTQRLMEAEDMYKQALEIYQRLAKDNPKAYEPDVAKTLNNLANLYRKTQRLTEAEDIYKQALEIRTRLAKDNPMAYEPDVARTLNNLAILYSDTQRPTEAENMYKQALEIQQRLAKDNPKTYERDAARTLNNLANLYQKNQRFTEAEEMYKQALEIRQRLAKDNPKAYEPDVATTLNNLASLYYKNRRPTEAEEMYKQALEIRQRLAKDNPKAYEPYVANTLNNLAILYSDTQRLKEAEDMYKQALEIRQRLAKDNPKAYELEVAQTDYCIGVLLIDKEQYTDAIPSFEDALYTYRRLAKDNSSLQECFFKSLHHLSKLYAKKKNRIRGYEICQELLPMMKELYEQDQESIRSDYASLLCNQAFNAIFMKKYSEAEQLAREGLSVDSTLHVIYTNLAAALLLQGRYNEAEPIYRQYKDELKESFLDDFEQFKAAGVIPKEREEDVEKIKQMLEE